MAREILFKAKRKNWKELPMEQWWVKGYLWNGNDHSYIIPYNVGIGYDSDANSLNATAYEIDKDTICQYTGLTDKNGNKIWENDIAKHYNKIGVGEPDAYNTIKFEWQPTGCMFKAFWIEGNGYYFVGNESDCVYEVIGNSIDNPELLEVLS